MILPYNSISRYSRRKSINKVKGFNLSSPKFQIGQIVNYRNEFKDGEDKVIIENKGIVIGYVFELGGAHGYEEFLGEWRYFLFWIDGQLCDYSPYYENDLTAV